MRSPFVWMFRVTWAALAFTAAPAIGEALDGRSPAVPPVGTIGSWVAWAIVLLASLVPTTVSLTVVRAIVPGAPLVAVVAWAAGASETAGLLAVATAGLAAVLAFSGDLGQVFVQGSAYGDERRFLLRPPGPLVVFVPLLWAIEATALLIGALALAAETWILGVSLVALAVPLGWTFGRRFHRLSRRWLVLVPAGIVLHDQVVLAETVMINRSDVESAALAVTGTEAADLTGMALGPAVELRLRDTATVVLAAAARRSTRALHVRSLLISPTRPGRVLRALVPAARAGGGR